MTPARIQATMRLSPQQKTTIVHCVRQRALTTLALELALGLPVDIVARQQGTPGGSFARVVQRHAQAIDGQGMSPSSLPCECAWP